jgi:hypothetical protein
VLEIFIFLNLPSTFPPGGATVGELAKVTDIFAINRPPSKKLNNPTASIPALFLKKCFI